ncbi:nuclear transport factor 2 family protein [Sphingobium sp. SCG-1]|uniref:nuclear transport factor 2 family protein n=1 Tax=Sphingobium sp. SCG-1 TaxID=2072936 RepID=UPI001670EFA3|nr:nuclear transport factor 2 family protein [Sphingobium sp. SCG-1]
MSDDDAMVGINAALARYVDGVNQRNAALWGTSWDVDAEWYLFGPQTISGREAIVAAWEDAMAGFPFVVMHVSQGHVTVNGDTATGRSYTNELARTRDGQRLRVLGQYDDRYRRRDGKWAFSCRRFTMLDTEQC